MWFKQILLSFYILVKKKEKKSHLQSTTMRTTTEDFGHNAVWKGSPDYGSLAWDGVLDADRRKEQPSISTLV